MVSEWMAGSLLDEWAHQSAVRSQERNPPGPVPIDPTALDRLADDGCPLHPEDQGLAEVVNVGG